MYRARSSHTEKKCISNASQMHFGQRKCTGNASLFRMGLDVCWVADLWTNHYSSPPMERHAASSLIGPGLRVGVSESSCHVPPRTQRAPRVGAWARWLVECQTVSMFLIRSSCPGTARPWSWDKEGSILLYWQPGYECNASGFSLQTLSQDDGKWLHEWEGNGRQYEV